MFNGRLYICFGDNIVSKYLRKHLMNNFLINIVYLTVFSHGTISTYPPHFSILEKKLSKKIVTLSPLLQGTLNYIIVNYRVSFGYMLCWNYLALIAFRSHLMESIWMVVGERKEVAGRNGHKEIDTDLISIPEALTSQLQVLMETSICRSWWSDDVVGCRMYTQRRCYTNGILHHSLLLLNFSLYPLNWGFLCSSSRILLKPSAKCPSPVLFEYIHFKFFSPNFRIIWEATHLCSVYIFNRKIVISLNFMESFCSSKVKNIFVVVAKCDILSFMGFMPSLRL